MLLGLAFVGMAYALPGGRSGAETHFEHILDLACLLILLAIPAAFLCWCGTLCFRQRPLGWYISMFLLGLAIPLMALDDYSDYQTLKKTPLMLNADQKADLMRETWLESFEWISISFLGFASMLMPWTRKQFHIGKYSELGDEPPGSAQGPSPQLTRRLHSLHNNELTPDPPP